MGFKFGKNVKILVADFDGVFTDGGAYIDEQGNISKKINFADIMGLYHFLKNGYKFAIISGEESSAVHYLVNKLKLEDVYQGVRDKSAVMKEIMDKYSFKADEIIYAGDDINDIAPMNMVKYAVAPKNANYKVKKVKNIQVSKLAGGSGFIREITDSILK